MFTSWNWLKYKLDVSQSSCRTANESEIHLLVSPVSTSSSHHLYEKNLIYDSRKVMLQCNIC